MTQQIAFSPSGDDLKIFHVLSNCMIGYVRVRGTDYLVSDEEGEDIAAVKSIGDIIPVLLRHFEKHPPRWLGGNDKEDSKATPFGLLRVVQDALGPWLAFRNDYDVLLRDGKPALFATAEEARQVADAHLRDGLPDFEPTHDRFSWLYDPASDLWRNHYH